MSTGVSHVIRDFDIILWRNERISHRGPNFVREMLDFHERRSYGGQGSIDFVGDAGRQATERRHLLGRQESGLIFLHSSVRLFQFL